MAAEESMRNKKQELKTLAQRFDIIDISETWWNECCDWSALLDVSRLFRSERQDRRGRGVALYVTEELERMELTVGNGTVESLWISGDKEDKKLFLHLSRERVHMLCFGNSKCVSHFRKKIIEEQHDRAHIINTHKKGVTGKVFQPHDHFYGPHLDLLNRPTPQGVIIQIPLGGITFFYEIKCITQLGVICRLADGEVYSIIYVINEDSKKY
ncbi:hypothetical protein DUI87_16447 [Hirundo rustica rustica]|uniref:Uncharacterized protein n=1 Tax=Hirundo rustica rustica TaxID=333673 RepID=A0A3M0K6S3_HIRRU|nr:hypothetical protein DUI87_16447 [Hirundo rustica rustica]